MEAPKEYEEVAALIRQRLGSWRKFTVAIDGSDHSGKSTISRYLAWQLGMSVIETDQCRKPGVSPIETDLALLKRLINARHMMNRPVIVEGITILQSLAEAGVHPDFLVLMKNTAFEGSNMFQERYAAYKEAYASKRAPDFELIWNSDNVCS